MTMDSEGKCGLVKSDKQLCKVWLNSPGWGYVFWKLWLLSSHLYIWVLFKFKYNFPPIFPLQFIQIFWDSCLSENTECQQDANRLDSCERANAWKLAMAMWSAMKLMRNILADIYFLSRATKLTFGFVRKRCKCQALMITGVRRYGPVAAGT